MKIKHAHYVESCFLFHFVYTFVRVNGYRGCTPHPSKVPLYDLVRCGRRTRRCVVSSRLSFSAWILARTLTSNGLPQGPSQMDGRNPRYGSHHTLVVCASCR